MMATSVNYGISPDETWIIKAIAIIAMIVHHLFYEHPEFGMLIVKIGVAGKVCVALFVFLSGYGMATSFSTCLQSKVKALLFFISKRYIKFFLNYWFIFFLSVPIGVFCFGRSLELAYGEGANLLKCFINDVFGQQSFCSYNITWWFNTTILSLWLSFPFFYVVMKNILTALFVLVLLFVKPYDVVLLLNVIAPGVSTYISIFALGIFFALHIERINRMLNKVHPYIVLYTSLVLSVLLIYLRGFSLFSGFAGYSVDPLATLFVVLAVVSFRRVTKYKFRIMRYIGKHSMNMYLTHTFIFGYFFYDFIFGFKYPLLIFGALFTSSLLLSMCIEFVKEKIRFYKLQKWVVGVIDTIGGLTLKEKQD